MTEQDLKDAIIRAFKTGCDYIRFDGHSARNEFLANSWNLAIQNGWITPKIIDLEQETFMKGYLTEKGRRELLENVKTIENTV